MAKPSLSAALKEVTRPERVLETASTPKAAKANTPVPPSRAGKKPITGFFDPAVSKQLKQIGLEHDATVQDLIREALNDLFHKYGRAPIA